MWSGLRQEPLQGAPALGRDARPGPSLLYMTGPLQPLEASQSSLRTLVKPDLARAHAKELASLNERPP